MRKLNTLIVSIILLALYGCKSNKTPEELKAIFYKNKDKLDLFANTLQKDVKLDSIFSNRTEEQGFDFPDIKETYPNIYNLLVDAGITEASSHRITRVTKWYFLKTNWPNEYPIYLEYNRFDSVKTKKGYYDKDEVSNETWGLGDHWIMFRWVKNKPYDQ